MLVNKEMFIKALKSMIEHIEDDSIYLENLSSSKSTKLKHSSMFGKQLYVHTNTISIDIQADEEIDINGFMMDKESIDILNNGGFS